MTEPAEAHVVELLAVADELAESAARAVAAVQELTDAQLAARCVDERTLEAYAAPRRSDPPRRSRNSALVAGFKTLIAVH